MGHDRSLVRHAFEDDNSEIDTHEDISHGINKNSKLWQIRHLFVLRNN